jgi:S1-C subfamily serine protease
MAEEREAADGTEGPGDDPVFPKAAGDGPANWGDLRSDPQWPVAWPSADGDPTAPVAGSGQGAPANWGSSAPEVPGQFGQSGQLGRPGQLGQDETWRDNTWRGESVYGDAPPYAGGLPSTPPGGGHRRSWTWAAVLAATVLVAGGAGAGIALAVSNNRASGGSKSLSLPSTGNSGPLSSNTQSLNVRSIASNVSPATVDLIARGSSGQDEGTGMVLTASGLVLTNNHVIDGSTDVTAQVDGKGQTYQAAVLGTDAEDDVALLQMKGGSSFKTVAVGDSAVITVGDPVVAIGNALGLPGPETVTNGIISATGRSITVGDPSSGLTEYLKDMFQSSAAINPGNSGGPLVDAAGKVIGMNTAEESGSGSGQSASNVGFAIPMNAAIAIARQIEVGKRSATVQIGPHAIMGVEVTSVTCAEGGDGCTALGNSSSFGLFGGSSYTSPVREGAVVAGVEQGDPAQAAGLAAGDVIVSVNGARIDSPDGLTSIMNFQRVGEKATVQWVDPNGQHRSATLNLIQGPNV